VLGDDPAAAYRETARALAEAWRQPGRLDRSYRLPFGAPPDASAVDRLAAYAGRRAQTPAAGPERRPPT
jgi:hypothetical protein